MFPFIDPVQVRFRNTGNRPVKIGYQVIGAGTEADIPVSTLHAPALTVARNAGVEFVGLVVGDNLYDLVLATEEVVEEEVEEAPDEKETIAAVAKKIQETVDQEILDELNSEKPDFFSSIDFVDKTDKEINLEAINKLKAEEFNFDPEPEPAVDYASFKKAELVVMATERGLVTDGMLKRDIVELLAEA